MGRKKKSVVLSESFGTDNAKFANLLVQETADAIQAFKSGKIERSDANTIFKGVNTIFSP